MLAQRLADEYELAQVVSKPEFERLVIVVSVMVLIVRCAVVLTSKRLPHSEAAQLERKEVMVSTLFLVVP